MSDFHRRLSLDEVSASLHLARERGLVAPEDKSLLVHDLGRMCHRIKSLIHIFPTNSLHALAIKANPVVKVLRSAVLAGAGLEAASIEEVHLALAAECPADRIVFDSPAKTNQELEEVLSLGAVVNANSFAELDRIDALYDELNSTSPVGLRVNPEVGGGSISHTSVGKKGAKFGEPISRDTDIIDAFRRFQWLSGIHSHVGSQGCGLNLLVEAVDRCTLLVKRIQTELVRTLRFLDIGGGLPAVYDREQVGIEPLDYVTKIQPFLDRLSNECRIVTEFGRAIQAGCGYTATRVEYVRKDPPMCVVHVGADLLLRPVYAAKDWHHEFFVLDAQFHEKTSDLRPIDITGPLCFSGDIIGRQVPLPKIEVGDWIVIRDTGAYTLSMWSHHCSRGLPKVLGFDPSTQQVETLRNADSPRDVVRFWSGLN